MNLKEYVDNKYKGKHKALSFAEAKAFGVTYPLEKGWYETYGQVEITPGMAVRMTQSLMKKKTPYAKKGVLVLSKMT